jgi:phage baseplate assembly protein W
MTDRAAKYTVTDKSTEFYSDFLNNLDAHPGNKQVMRYVNEEAVKNAIRNLINTNKYSRFFRPLLGCDLRKLLFKNCTPQTAAEIKDAIVTTITNYEKRVINLSVDCIAMPTKNAFQVLIAFNIVNKSTPVTFTQILYRVR